MPGLGGVEIRPPVGFTIIRGSEGPGSGTVGLAAASAASFSARRWARTWTLREDMAFMRCFRRWFLLSLVVGFCSRGGRRGLG